MLKITFFSQKCHFSEKCLIFPTPIFGIFAFPHPPPPKIWGGVPPKYPQKRGFLTPFWGIFSARNAAEGGYPKKMTIFGSFLTLFWGRRTQKWAKNEKNPKIGHFWPQISSKKGGAEMDKNFEFFEEKLIIFIKFFVKKFFWRKNFVIKKFFLQTFLLKKKSCKKKIFYNIKKI